MPNDSRERLSLAVALQPDPRSSTHLLVFQQVENNPNGQQYNKSETDSDVVTSSWERRERVMGLELSRKSHAYEF